MRNKLLHSLSIKIGCFFFDTTDQHLLQHAHHWLPIRVLFQLEDKKSLSARSGLYAGRGETRQISTCAWTSTAIVKNCVTIAHKVFPEISNRDNSLPLCQNFQRNSITTRCLNHTSTIVLTTMHAFCFRLLPLDVARIQWMKDYFETIYMLPVSCLFRIQYRKYYFSKQSILYIFFLKIKLCVLLIFFSQLTTN